MLSTAAPIACMNLKVDKNLNLGGPSRSNYLYLHAVSEGDLAEK